MKVLIACEESGIVRDAFINMKHETISCDLIPSRRLGPHYQGDIRDLLHYPWDLMIAHPPCTDTCVSGARHFAAKQMRGLQYAAVSFFMELWEAKIPRICIEQPISIISTVFRKPDQIVQPWMFGHYETKATCLWLKGLEPLIPVYATPNELREVLKLPADSKPKDRIHKMAPSADRAKLRSETYAGIGDAMAKQWGKQF